MRLAWKVVSCIVLVFFCHGVQICKGQDYDFSPTGTGGSAGGGGTDDEDTPAATPPPPGQDACNGIFVTYTFTSRTKEYPLVKNASAQAWSFKSQLTVLNAGVNELKAWKVFVGFQHREILVSVDGAVVTDAEDLPAHIGKKGATLAGYPMTDLKTAIDTAGDYTQMQANVEISGTQFGLKTGTPMPRTVKLVNDGYKCPAPTRRKTTMHVCCRRDPKYKVKRVETKFLPRQKADLSMTYDVLQAFEGNYQAQVTIDNLHPLGRLDHWNLTWEWMRGEFINTMRGAYTYKKDPSECVYGPQGQYYKSFDFTPVMNCQRKPVITDLPRDHYEDEKVGKLPYCCRNGTLLPTIMNETESRAIFQLQVFKMPPDLNRTAIHPPQHWKINGVLNPEYKCGPPIRIDPSEFPDPSGLAAKTSAMASWQVSCNITRPKPKQARCCVSFSAYYADSVVPCPTCACGCEEESSMCDQNARALPLPPEALLVPFDNRTAKAKAWAKIKHHELPKRMPCPDNCGVSINWHVDTDYKSGWTARMTLFNWGDQPYEDWFTAIQMKKAFRGYENVYSFNGTKLSEVNNTIFFQGLKGLNYLVGEVNGTHPEKDPRVPGKQQSVISFLKKRTPNIQVPRDGFPSKVIFNGEECALPSEFPKKSGAYHKACGGFLPSLVLAIVTFVVFTDRFP